MDSIDLLFPIQHPAQPILLSVYVDLQSAKRMVFVDRKNKQQLKRSQKPASVRLLKMIADVLKDKL